MGFPLLLPGKLSRKAHRHSKRQQQQQHTKEVGPNAKTVEDVNKTMAVLKGQYLPPAILITQTQSTESGIETTLTTSYDHGMDDIVSTMSSHDETICTPIIIRAPTSNRKPSSVNAGGSISSQSQKQVSSSVSVGKKNIPPIPTLNPSQDLTAASSFTTSVSQVSSTMDVHACTSLTCKLCRGRKSGTETSTQQGTTFVPVDTLDSQMITKLRSGPPRWYELGVSFIDLYHEANRANRKRRQQKHRSKKKKMDVESRQDLNNDDISRVVQSGRGTRKSRSLKMVSSDGDEAFCY